jgi:hypothetical protein
VAATLLSALVVCLASLFVGQAILRLSGAREWSWLAPMVGFAALMLIGSPGVDVPGRATTMSIVLAVITVAAIVWCMSSASHRPPLGGLLTAVPVVILVLLPFLAAGRAGILGVNLDNDMAAHMVFAETYLSEAVENLHPRFYDLYPFGPHAVAGILARGLHQRVDHTFTGLTMAIPVLTAWTVLGLVRRSSWWKQAVAATVISMPFLVAGYYGQGSFKELIQTGLVLATVIYFAGEGPPLGRGRWVPLAVLVGGMISVYSETGVAWPVVIGGLWLLLVTVRHLRERGTAGIAPEVLAELPAIGIGLAVLILSLLPQVSRIHNFFTANSGANGIIVPKSVLGNLVAPLPGWEGFGYWNIADYRLPAAPAFTAGMWIALIFALVLFGAWRLCRQGRWMLPLSAAGSMVIWRVSMHSQSPYVVAKALVIASPLLLMLAVLPLLEQIPDRPPRPGWWRRERVGGSVRSIYSAVPGQPLSYGLATALVAVLFVLVGVSDVRALRASPVGPTGHVDQLREIRPLLGDHRTLFLGNDDFVKWELPGVPVVAPIFGAKERLFRPGKHWEEGEPLDFDAVDAETLDSIVYVITTRDAAGSQPPPQMHLVASAAAYQLWRRVGQVQERSILAEGGEPGAVLDCGSRRGRKIVRAGGVAAVRPAPVVVPGAALAPGGTVTLALPLVKGEWTLEASYTSGLPITVTGSGLDATLGANLDRLGPRWPFGKLVIGDKETVELTFTVGDTLFAPNLPITNLASITATPKARERVVPIAQACGRYVDWYRSGGSAR